jgi:RecJ-like exonuclease
MATECKFCAGTGNLGGGKKCAKCGGTGKILDPGETAEVAAPTPTMSSRRGRRRSKPN